MSTPQQLRNRLLKKLKELFQLDQPDLDFGFYRIMHAKSVQVREFIEKDLLKIVLDAFGEVDEARSESLKADYEKAIEIAKEFGAPEPEKAPKVQEAKARWESSKDTATSEGDIYDHLYRFRRGTRQCDSFRCQQALFHHPQRRTRGGDGGGKTCSSSGGN